MSWLDDFNRTSGPGDGLGPDYRWSSFDSQWASVDESETYLDGSAVRVPANQYDSYLIGPSALSLGSSGEASFDIRFPADTDDFQIRVDIYLSTPGGRAVYFGVGSNLSDAWLIYTWDSAPITVTPDRGVPYRVKTTWSGENQTITIWKVGDAETGALWSGSNTATPDDFSLPSGESVIDFYNAPATEDLWFDNLSITDSPAFSVDAIIQGSPESGTNLDADILVGTRSEGSLAANAALFASRQPPFASVDFWRDDFNRASGPGEGLGPNYRWSDYDSAWGSAAASQTYLDGSAVRVPAGQYDSYLISPSELPLPASGTASFDFRVPAASDDNNLDIRLILEHPVQSIVAWVSIPGGIFEVQTRSATVGLYAPERGATYRLQTTWDVIAKIQTISLWKVGDAEPAPAWSGTNTALPNYTGLDGESVIDFYYAPESEDLWFDNLLISGPYSVPTADAVIGVVLVSDTFSRTTSAGSLGTSDSGSAWTITSGTPSANGSALAPAANQTTVAAIGPAFSGGLVSIDFYVEQAVGSAKSYDLYLTAGGGYRRATVAVFVNAPGPSLQVNDMGTTTQTGWHRLLFSVDGDETSNVLVTRLADGATFVGSEWLSVESAASYGVQLDIRTGSSPPLLDNLLLIGTRPSVERRGSFAARAVAKKTRTAAFSANAELTIETRVTASFGAQSTRLRPGIAANLGAQAEILVGSRLYGSLAADAVIVAALPARLTHPRDNTLHRGATPDDHIYTTVVVGPYPAGTDLHTVLEWLWSEYAARGSIMRRLRGLAANAVVLVTRAGSLSVAAYMARTTSATLSAAAVTKASVSSTAGLDAILATDVSASLTVDAVVGTVSSVVTASLTADAIVGDLDWSDWSLTWSGIIFATQTGSFSTNSALLRPVSSSLTADAVISSMDSFDASAFQSGAFQ